jgi:hypothetical protein
MSVSSVVTDRRVALSSALSADDLAVDRISGALLGEYLTVFGNGMVRFVFGDVKSLESHVAEKLALTFASGVPQITALAVSDARIELYGDIGSRRGQDVTEWLVRFDPIPASCECHDLVVDVVLYVQSHGSSHDE